MSSAGEANFEPQGPNSPRKWGIVAACVLVVCLLGYLLYGVLSNIDGVAVKSAPPTMVDMLPPPPPPPPPPPEKPPEPMDKPQDQPDLAPQPDKPAPAPMQINGPAQAGSDAYGMSAGTGGGMGAPAAVGACTGPNCGGAKLSSGLDRFWGRNVANQLEDYIEGKRAVNVDSFNSQFDVWVNPAGAITQVRLANSSGDSRLDQTLLALLRQASGLKPPPPSIQMPQRIKVGRKRL